MKKTLFLFVVAGMLSMTFVGCGEQKESADTEAAEYTENVMSRANDIIGFPSINNYTERGWARMIFELRDRADLQTYTYLYVPMTGELRFMCHSVGYGLPYSVQYTNPDRPAASVVIADNARDNGRTLVSGMMPQPDPNGLFMPQGLSATWILAIQNGELKPIYVEPEILVSPFPLTKDTPEYP